MATNTIFVPSDLARLRPLVSPETLAALATMEEGDDMPSVFADANGDEFDYRTLSDIALKEWANEASEHIYQLGKRVFAHMGDVGWEGIFEAGSIEEYIGTLDHGSATIEDMLVTFGVIPKLDVAKRGYEDSCRVWITHCYDYCELQAPYDTWAKDDPRNILEFESYAAAQKWIRKAKADDRGYRTKTNPAGHYIYSHGEVKPKKYTICKGWR